MRASLFMWINLLWITVILCSEASCVVISTSSTMVFSLKKDWLQFWRWSFAKNWSRLFIKTFIRISVFKICMQILLLGLSVKVLSLFTVPIRATFGCRLGKSDIEFNRRQVERDGLKVGGRFGLVGSYWIEIISRLGWDGLGKFGIVGCSNNPIWLGDVDIVIFVNFGRAGISGVGELTFWYLLCQRGGGYVGS